MAKSNRNVITHGLSGKVGDLVLFSQRFGSTVMGKIPIRTKGPSVKQIAVQEKFVQAARYGRECIADPVRKAIYELRAGGGITAYNLAFADFFYAPKIHEINVEGYSGQPGGTISIHATDDTQVMAVSVGITSAAGQLLEEGGAVLDPEKGHWIYTCTMANAPLAGSKIVVTAKDRPGNMTIEERTL